MIGSDPERLCCYNVLAFNRSICSSGCPRVHGQLEEGRGHGENRQRAPGEERNGVLDGQAHEKTQQGDFYVIAAAMTETFINTLSENDNCLKMHFSIFSINCHH